MARPLSRGVDYFPLDVDIDQDDKIALIEVDHGLIGFAVVIKLFMKIYSEGYYYQWSEIEQKLFQRRVNVDADTLLPIVNDCIKYGLFDENAYRKHNILTSRGIQERYFKIVSRRKDVRVHEQYLVLDEDEIKEYKNLTINSHCQSDELMSAITSNEEGLMSTLTTNDGELMMEETRQRKGKESRVNQSKEKGDYITDANASGGTTVDQLMIDQVEQVEEKPKKKPTLKAWERRAKKSEGFQQFVSEYPEHRRLGRYQAFLTWERRRIDDDPELFEKTMKWLRLWVKSEDWTKDDGQYVPNIDRFINKYWEEEQLTPRKAQSSWKGNGNQGHTIASSVAAMNIDQSNRPEITIESSKADWARYQKEKEERRIAAQKWRAEQEAKKQEAANVK